MSSSSSPRRGRRSLSALIAVAVLAVVAVLGFQTSAVSRSFHAVPAPPANPTNSNQIQNIDQVRTAIKAYYGDSGPTSTFDPVDGKTALHFATPTSAYAKEVGRLEKSAAGYLKKAHGSDKAILLDVDDTSLNTYNYEIYSNFAYNPTTNAAFVNSAAFPAVFGMPKLAQDAEAAGYEVFFLTGRPEGQRAGTEKNLTDTGYPVTTAKVGDNVDNVFLKDVAHAWTTCDTTGDKVCSTIEVKSETRKYIESLGYDIKANFGDQYSDLSGGYADRTFKLPNPMYYLP
ncbi:MAG: HAD family acid phosphatase [Nocardioidaceae bacterium]